MNSAPCLPNLAGDSEHSYEEKPPTFSSSQDGTLVPPLEGWGLTPHRIVRTADNRSLPKIGHGNPILFHHGNNFGLKNLGTMNNQTRMVALELKSYLVRDGDDYRSRREAIVYRSTTEIADAADISAIISHADIAAEQPQDIGLKQPKGPMYYHNHVTTSAAGLRSQRTS